MKLVCQSNGKLYLRNVSYEERDILALLGAKFLPGEGYSGKFKGSHGGEVYQQVEVFQMPGSAPGSAPESEQSMNNQQICLHYGWKETKWGVCHAFCVTDTNDSTTDAAAQAIATQLASTLGTEVGGDDFNWDSTYINLPKTLLQRLTGQKEKSDNAS